MLIYDYEISTGNVHVWRTYLDIKHSFIIIFCYFNFDHRISQKLDSRINYRLYGNVYTTCINYLHYNPDIVKYTGSNSNSDGFNIYLDHVIYRGFYFIWVKFKSKTKTHLIFYFSVKYAVSRKSIHYLY